MHNVQYRTIVQSVNIEVIEALANVWDIARKIECIVSWFVFQCNSGIDLCCPSDVFGRLVNWLAYSTIGEPPSKFTSLIISSFWSSMPRSAAEYLPQCVGKQRQGSEHDMHVRFGIAAYAQMTQTELILESAVTAFCR